MGSTGNVSMMKGIGGKILLIFVAMSLVSIAVLSVFAITTSTSALRESSFNQLTVVREIKKSQIENFFAERRGDMGVLLETVNTLRDGAFEKMGIAQSLKKSQLDNYVETMKNELKVLKDDPYVQEALVEFDREFEAAGDSTNSSGWRALANAHDDRLADIMNDNGWYDIFLVSPVGEIVYTVTREADLGMVIPDSELKNSPLGDAFFKAQNAGSEEIVLADFAPYAPSGGAPGGFMMGKMLDGAGGLIGYVAFQIPIVNINEIMLQREGMGETGESYLVGTNLLMRSDSYLDPVGHSVVASFKNNTTVDTDATRSAFSGSSGAGVIIDYNGNPVLSVWNPIDLGSGVTWAMITEIDVAEAFVPVDQSGVTFYERYVEMYGYYDLFLINPDGYVFYSASKEADYQTNMVSGRYNDSGLGKLVQRVLSTKKYSMQDFSPYAPSDGEPASFIAEPSVHNGQVEMVVALQLSLDAINSIMMQRAGMGETGETYLVGQDKLMRSDSFLDSVNHTVAASFANPLQGNVDTEASQEALGGRSDTRIITDYNGNPVLSAYTPVNLGDVTWALLAEIDQAEVNKPINDLVVLIVIIAVVVLVVVIIVALLFSRTISKPLGQVTKYSNRIASGDFSVEVQTVKSKDEIGMLTGSFQEMLEALKYKAVVIQKIADGDLTTKVELASDDDSLGKSLSEMAVSLNDVISQVSEAVSQVSSGSNQVSSASQSLSQGAAEQASSLEEISSSLNEINSQSKQNAENATEANAIAKTASENAVNGNEQMQGLMDSMEKISASAEETTKVVKVIDDIAFQINLLALNANVEAARAGKYGKGFAVVADEVRNLAVRSGDAVKETTAIVEGTTANMREGAEAAEATAKQLVQIVEGSSKVAEYLGEIALASKEQAQGVEQINSGLEQIDQVTQSNTASAEESASAAEELAAQSEQLKGMIARFKVDKRGGLTGAQSQRAAFSSAPGATEKPVAIGLPAAPRSGNGKPVASDAEEVINLENEDFGQF
jgi:methyl-accepting chemotaxis protein